MTTYYVYGVEPAGTTRMEGDTVTNLTYRLLAKSDSQDIANSSADRFRRIFGQVIVTDTPKTGKETTVEANDPF